MKTRDQIFPRLIGGLILALAAMTSAPAAFAQSAPGDTTVEIRTPITINKTADLEFGDFVAGTTNSRFRINPNTGALTQHSGNAVSIGGTQGQASFTVTGTPFLRVRITSGQNRIFIVRDGGTETMRVNRFRFDGARNRFLDASGEVTYRVGGQLRVGPNQAVGTYRGSFNITVDYF